MRGDLTLRSNLNAPLTKAKQPKEKGFQICANNY